MRHLALIMDGNRRWAKQQGLRAFYGHGRGVETVKRVVDFCLKKKISYLSLYTFSLENFKRSPDEIRYLFELLIRETEQWLDQLLEQGVRVRFIGDRTQFPSEVIPSIENIEQATGAATTLQVSLLFCYGGQQEIINGVKEIISRVKTGAMTEHDLNEELFKNFLWTSGIPEPDLIVRTGGYQRLSNFLLYQAAYSELYFLDCLWPDLQTDHLEQAVAHFELSQRNFGT